MSRISQLLDQARDGDDAARQQAVALLHDDLARLARSTTAGAPSTPEAAALVEACYRRVADGESGLDVNGRSHFLALAGRAMRQLLVERANERLAAGTPGDAAADREARDLVDLDAVLAELAREDERIVQVVDSRVFGGLTEVETAEALRQPLRIVQRCWARAKERLRTPLIA